LLREAFDDRFHISRRILHQLVVEELRKLLRGDIGTDNAWNSPSQLEVRIGYALLTIMKPPFQRFEGLNGDKRMASSRILWAGVRVTTSDRRLQNGPTSISSLS
jgi:hypothetical protein